MTLSAMLLQGSLHVMMPCLLLVGCYGLVHRNRWKDVLIAIGATFLLGSIRFLPAGITFHGFERQFLTGFPSTRTMIESLVSIHGPQTPPIPGLFGGDQSFLDWWEYDTFIGIAGLTFVLLFGVRAMRCNARFRPLSIPLALIVTLSISAFYLPLFSLPVPLLNAERIPSRFLGIAIAFLAMMASVEFDDAPKEWHAKKWFRPTMLAALAFTFMALVTHSRLWCMEEIHRGVIAWDLGKIVFLDNEDVLYQSSVLTGAAISLITLMIIGILVMRRKKTGALIPESAGSS